MLVLRPSLSLVSFLFFSFSILRDLSRDPSGSRDRGNAKMRKEGEEKKEKKEEITLVTARGKEERRGKNW